MREEDKRSPSVTEEEYINSVWVLFLLCDSNTGKFQILLQECAVVEKYIMYYLFTYLSGSSRFEPCTRSAASGMWNSILVTLIQSSVLRRHGSYSRSRVGRVVRPAGTKGE
jgi:hypothetical protein